MLETFTVGTFAPHLGARFRIRPDGLEPVEVVLIEATALGGGGGGTGGGPGRRTPFSIVFRGPRTPLLPQRIYPMEHDAIGTFDLFLVPIGPDQEGMRYEAVFT